MKNFNQIFGPNTLAGCCGGPGGPGGPECLPRRGAVAVAAVFWASWGRWCAMQAAVVNGGVGQWYPMVGCFVLWKFMGIPFNYKNYELHNYKWMIQVFFRVSP